MFAITCPVRNFNVGEKIMAKSQDQKKNISDGVDNKEFAVIQTGGKQYKVAKGDVILIEKLSPGLKAGDKVIFDKVLLVDNGKDTTIGMPFISGAKVEATFQEEGRGKKLIVVKYKAKSRYFKSNGHRQPFAKVKIDAIK